jgi:heptosyltransferase-2
MHIAAAFNVPIVAVFGPTDARTTSPVGSPNQIVREPVECSPCLLRECPIDHRCMRRISVERVYEAAVEQLQAISHQQSTIRDQSSVLSPAPLRLKGVTVFLDRDGTINRDTGYVRSPDELELFPDAVEALARLNRAGARLVLITNQSGIARAMLTHETLRRIHAELGARLESGGARLDAIYYCPHHPDEGCSCRKPQLGMVSRAVADLGLDLSRIYLVGDKRHDIELARRLGAKSVLVTTGPTSPQALALLEAGGMPPDCVASNLNGAADWILEDGR